MELIIEFEPDQKSPLQIIEQIREAIELELKRNSIRTYTIALLTSYDPDKVEVLVLHAQGYETKKEG